MVAQCYILIDSAFHNSTFYWNLDILGTKYHPIGEKLNEYETDP